MNKVFVRSRYSARWKGVVLNIEERPKLKNCFKGKYRPNPLYTVLMVRDSSNNIPRKRYVATMDKAWFEEIPEIDLSNINPDWFKSNYVSW